MHVRLLILLLFPLLFLKSISKKKNHNLRSLMRVYNLCLKEMLIKNPYEKIHLQSLPLQSLQKSLNLTWSLSWTLLPTRFIIKSLPPQVPLPSQEHVDVHDEVLKRTSENVIPSDVPEHTSGLKDSAHTENSSCKTSTSQANLPKPSNFFSTY